MKRETFTRADVIKMMDGVLQEGALLLDAVWNENTEINGESLLEVVEPCLDVETPISQAGQ